MIDTKVISTLGEIDVTGKITRIVGKDDTSTLRAAMNCLLDNHSFVFTTPQEKRSVLIVSVSSSLGSVAEEVALSGKAPWNNEVEPWRQIDNLHGHGVRLVHSDLKAWESLLGYLRNATRDFDPKHLIFHGFSENSADNPVIMAYIRQWRKSVPGLVLMTEIGASSDSVNVGYPDTAVFESILNTSGKAQIFYHPNTVAEDMYSLQRRDSSEEEIRAAMALFEKSFPNLFANKQSLELKEADEESRKKGYKWLVMYTQPWSPVIASK